MNELMKSRRGGKREGAGRPRSNIATVTVSFLMEKELYDIVNMDTSIKSRGQFLNDAVRYVLKERTAFDSFLEKTQNV